VVCWCCCSLAGSLCDYSCDSCSVLLLLLLVRARWGGSSAAWTTALHPPRLTEHCSSSSSSSSSEFSRLDNLLTVAGTAVGATAGSRCYYCWLSLSGLLLAMQQQCVQAVISDYR
jgi:hypothetical protein